MSDSLQPHESQHTRPPCPSPTPGVYSNSRPSSQWCHPAISSSVVPFSSCLPSLPASRSFPMSQLFAWGGQSIGVSASASVLPVNTQDWSLLEWTGWISLQSKGLSRVAQSCPTLCNLMDCSLLGFSVHGILQARILKCADIPFSRGFFQPRDWTCVSCIAGRFFTIWATKELTKPGFQVYKDSLGWWLRRCIHSSKRVESLMRTGPILPQ